MSKFSIDEIKKDLDDRNFDEYPVCNLCGSDQVVEKLKTHDNCTIVACETCQLWFTSPRLSEEKWEFFIRSVNSDRNRRLTENRIKYGVALQKNIARQPKDWRERMRMANRKTFRQISRWADKPIERIHDVGCGVGFFLIDMKKKGIEVSGNDLNGYACEVMNSRFELNVSNCNFGEVSMPAESVDLVYMNDFIEHTYHPFEDIKEAFRVIKSGGLIYLQTFMIDSDPFIQQGGNWNMLFWNHVYHFSTQSLVRMVDAAGFRIRNVNPKVRRGMIEVVASKP